MNDMSKNLLLWIVVAVVLMAVFRSFTPPGGGIQELAYSSFIQEARDGRVGKVHIGQDEISLQVTRTDGSRYRVNAPRRDQELMNDLLGRDSRIEVRLGAQRTQRKRADEFEIPILGLSIYCLHRCCPFMCHLQPSFHLPSS